MLGKQKSKFTKSKSIATRIAKATGRTRNAGDRTYVIKHAAAISFFYKSEMSEIDTMIQAANNIARKKQ